MLYDIAFLIFSIFYLPTLIFKGKFHKDFAERFGAFSDEKRSHLESSRGAIWIQAVSVGEVALCKSLIPELKRRYADRAIVLSTITKTGNDLAKRLFSDKALVIYFPLDFSAVVKKVVSLIKPSLYVMVETEVWPNLLKELGRLGVPSVLINGRISDRSFGKYMAVKAVLKKTLERINSFCMQSNIDAARIECLGAPRTKVKMTGNMKFDIGISVREDGSAMRQRLGIREDDQLIVAGSTHRGEEEIIVSVFKKLTAEFPNLKLLIAPRHVERASEIQALIESSGFAPIRLSSLDLRLTTYDIRQIFILDTIGQLRDAYAIATVVFIGGSLVMHGGQNPIESAILAKPIIFGPYMFNFKDIRRLFLDAGAALEVTDEDAMTAKMRSLLKDDQERSLLGARAKRVVEENRGATERNLAAIGELLVSKLYD